MKWLLFNTKRQFLSNITYKHAVQSTRIPKVSENRSMSHNIIDLDQKCHSGASMLNQKIFFDYNLYICLVPKIHFFAPSLTSCVYEVSNNATSR